MTDASISLSFPAKQNCAIFLRTAVSGAAAAMDLPLDALEDLREAALEAFSALLDDADENAQALCDIYCAQPKHVTLHLRLNGRMGVLPDENAGDITRAVIAPLVHTVQVFYDARGCTGVRVMLRVE